MPLVIVESPNKIAKIKQILGSGYDVVASVGHIMDLDKKKMGVEIGVWDPHYVINPDKNDVVKKIKEAAKNHKDIYIASDADFEGHSISYNIKSILPAKGKNIYRAIFKTITKPDVMAGIQNPIPFDELAYDAQKTRRITDRVIGFKVSPSLWSNGLKGTSAGRVQSAALKFIIDREREIKAFKQEEYWTISAETDQNFNIEFFGAKGKKIVPSSKEQVDDIVKKLQKDLIVSDYQKKSRSREPVAPYNTASLQKDAGTRFGWSSKHVMDMAQSLFASGLTTYIRTDSTTTEPGKLIDLRDLIEQQHGKNYLSPKTISYSKDNSQGAHECIRPTFEPTPMTLSNDERKLLDLITARFTASQMASAIFDQVSVKFETPDSEKFEFRASGSVQEFDGFLKVYGTSTKDVSLPAMKKGQKIKINKLIPTQHFTKPPARYTEPAFTEMMEKSGIGRPSTYAATIETLLNRKYVIRDGKALKGTEIGDMVCTYLEANFVNYTNPDFTANMELEVDKIAEGKLQKNAILDKFYEELLKSLDFAKANKNKILFQTEKECPKCKNNTMMIKKISEYGVFLGCPNHPTCGEIFNIGSNGELIAAKVETGLPCPECSSPVVERTSKWGKFLACENSNCKWTGKLDKDGNIAIKKKQELTDIDCSCGKKMVKRTGPKGTFFLGCQDYPKCKNTMNLDENGNATPSKARTKKSTAKSTGKKCPKCKKNDLVIREKRGTGETFIACGGFPTCKYIEKKEG